jgi:CubicO group peptidase (beta-lactamase class C family)
VTPASALADAAKRHRVPGAALAIFDGANLHESAAGVVNQQTGVEATPDAVFAIGSITKLLTATLAMQLVDEGLLELDAPVRRYLPQLSLADEEAAARITVRQLLTHTSGIDGDFFVSTGRGDDCLERYVLACSALPQLHPPGRLWSYCNAGFVLLGRVVEILRRQVWDEVLRTRLSKPLGSEGTQTLHEEMLRHRVAIGHFVDPTTGESVPAPPWREMRANGPAGSTAVAMARDLVRFARLHLAGGIAHDGARLVSERAVTASRARRSRSPGRTPWRGGAWAGCCSRPAARA